MPYTNIQEWQIIFSGQAKKQLLKLPKKLNFILDLLINEMRLNGPYMHEWPNYGKLKTGPEERYHCHLKKGHPTYVCCWKIITKQNKIIEIYYVGTHEKAPYQ